MERELDERPAADLDAPVGGVDRALVLDRVGVARQNPIPGR